MDTNLNPPKTEQKNYRFFIHMQMIVDGLMEAGISCTFHNKEITPQLCDISFYRGHACDRQDVLYIVRAEDLPDAEQPQVLACEAQTEKMLPASMVVIGNPPASWFDSICSMILVPAEADIFEIYEIVNLVFHRARSWNTDMQNIINTHGSLKELCAAAEEYFRNPLFIHNPNFYILACNTHMDGMDPWQMDERTGQPMLSAELINGFKMNPEYIDTLNKVGSQIYPIDSTGYRVMYVNLWDDYGRYEGRICIDEIKTAFQPGQMAALEHFGRMAMVLMHQRNFQTLPFEKPFERLITEMVAGKKGSPKYLEGILDAQGWKMNDTYRVFKMELDWRDRQTSSIINTCNYIEGTISECHAIQIENSILVILNCTKTARQYDEIIQILNRIVRETILLTGISNTFEDFSNLAYYVQQASLALQYGKKKNPTIWIHRFEQYVMDYCFDMVCKELPREFICSPQIMKVRMYDQEKHTELYDTLKTYVNCMLNAEQAAKELYIHRSTLFYRLKKIREISGIDLNEPENMFYIQFSMHLLETDLHAGTEPVH